MAIRRTSLALVMALLIAFTLYTHLHERPIPPTPLPARKPVVETNYFPAQSKETAHDALNGVKKYVFRNPVLMDKQPKDNTLLVVANIGNSESFGSNRHFIDLMTVIESFEYDRGAMNLAFFCGTEELFTQVDAFFTDLFQQGKPDFPKVTVLSADFLASKYSASEHSPGKQRERRRLIARSRNFALLNSLDLEQHTLFIDADIISIKHPDMIKRFIASGKDIIVPRVSRGSSMDYDKNSWRGTRTKPSADQLLLMDSNSLDLLDYVPQDVKDHMFHMVDFAATDSTLDSLDTAVELDSVGGAILYAKSIIYKQGVVFPPTYVVGTTWERWEGYDGIETEGLCYLARPLGYSCWGMPNLVAQHTE